jgi:sulfate adenylyltransferase subunit 1 (EFTu-like GTPase family)
LGPFSSQDRLAGQRTNRCEPGTARIGRIAVSPDARDQERFPGRAIGLKVGDAALSCNGSPIAAVKHEREAKRLCRVEVGEMLALEVKRGNEYLLIEATAERRAGL